MAVWSAIRSQASASLLPSSFIIFYLSSTPDGDYVSKVRVFNCSLCVVV